MTRKDLEIMAPAGNFECLHAAIQGGADSVYFGIGSLNMRSHSANNFRPEDLPEICSICRSHGVKSYLTLNIVLYDEDLADMRRTLDAAREAGVTAVIASDMAAIMYAREIGVEVHISTQLSISNLESLRFYSRFADVIVLARELNLHQVKEIKEGIVREGIKGPSGRPVEIEMFAHGALCMAISGKCYLSLHEYGASANRGSCYQICRRGYEVTDLETGNRLVVDNKYIMSPKDLCTIEFMDKIIGAGVSVFKIEGRARSAEYVRRTASCYRRAADAVCDGTYTAEMAAGLKKELEEVFNRGFWDGYYMGARLGEWSEVYGSKATRRKVYCGKVTNWFGKIGVAEILVESAALHKGDRILVMGPSTGVVELTAGEIRVDLKETGKAEKGIYCSIPVPDELLKSCGGKLRRSDKVYIWEEAGPSKPNAQA
ncbi:MAG: U32 family peptidase [Bacteroidetes bacterium]|uniref:U32 family peptidase n=1 Tax=Candidatus Cryptobacteroides gallistercoris TaxID=2840765 RepID=A0A940IFD1_9BACT|nr:U32 family peptidase [Candidatus Cryptobacteroides gallistercoris]